jgi:hypothetical protein
MPRIFPPLRRAGSGLVAGALVSLALAGAGALAVGAPPASASITPPDCWWHQLSLMNGWQSDQGTYGTGDPQYCITSGGMVYLSGSLTQPSAGVNEFAVLPQQAWPGSTLYLSVYTMDGTAGVLQINPNGAMFAYNGESNGDVTGFTSLAGVSFPEGVVTQKMLTLVNGWKSAQGEWGTGDPSFLVTGDGVVHLSGSLDGSQVPSGLGYTAEEFAVLPPGAAPDFCSSKETYTYAGVPGTLGIEPSGRLNAYAQGGAIYNSPSDSFTSLAGVSFPAAGVANWHALGLQSGWSPGEGDCFTTSASVDPSYSIINGVVYLTGAMVSSTNNNGPLTVLPPEARPTHALYLTLNEGPAPHASLEISPSGAVIVFGSGPANGVDMLGGLSYQVSS